MTETTTDELPITKKLLIDWAGRDVVREAESLVDRGLVLEAEYDPPYIRGAVLWSNRELKTALRLLPEGTVESECPCWTNRERGLICSHVIALAVALVRRNTDPRREAKYKEELRRASRVASFRESDYIQRVPEGTPGAIPARIEVALGQHWMDGYRRGAVPLVCRALCRGTAVLLHDIPKALPLCFPRDDQSLLYVLEDICEGPARGGIEATRADFLNVLAMHAGRTIGREGAEPVTVSRTAVPTNLRVDLDRENGEVLLIAHTELPFCEPGEFPFHMVFGKTGWVYGAGHAWPLAKLLPEPYHLIYEEPVVVQRPDVVRFFIHELPTLAKTMPVESDLSLDLFSIDPAAPAFRLYVRGSLASLSATLYARYGEVELVAGKPSAQGDFAIPDPDDLLAYGVRNPDAELAALRHLWSSGFQGECGDALESLVGRRQVLNFIGGRMPELRRRGWRIDMEGRASDFVNEAEFATPVVHVDDAEDGSWFDVGFGFETAGGLSISHSDVQLALRKGDAYIERGGRLIIVDADAVNSMLAVFSDCASGESDAAGRFRMDAIYTAYVKSSLDALDGVDIEEPPTWRRRAETAGRLTRVDDVALPEALTQVLRPYQKQAVNWLAFLEANGFCGILADEMGLGKTVQALAWLQLARVDPEAQGKPSLVVCPTSLVENWQEEAKKFTPNLRVLILSGPDRHERWEELPQAGLAITSYALLRRDIDHHLSQTYAVVLLDEAQHIKNRTTQNAIAAKQLRAANRLVLTGTPMENSVADLWSIMDFLMPGYLGSHQAFKADYEIPIAKGDAPGKAAPIRLRRKLHPFLLRRIKTEVAKDLPDRIERIAWCSLTPDQHIVYSELLASSRRQITELVAERGFNRCRMQVLATLMRLRQACCHLELLKLPELDPKFPSAKLDLFLELLDEAIDSGHRVLVFSQFVSMLKILRRELDDRSLTYCYLDGSTKERLDVVHRFNTQRNIPAFLISLKAGGTGLNLTGADMVIHFDPWWNPAVEDQATDRAHRIGQKRTVYSVKLITQNTVEERVLALQEKKQAIIDATVNAATGAPPDVTWEDVQQLLGL